MIDGIFLINNALRVNQLSVYNNEERFKQTLETMESIDQYCPSNIKYMFDSSPEEPEEELEELKKRGVRVFYNGSDPLVRQLSLAGARSIAETLTLQKFFEDVEITERARRVYKLSGRYRLNGNFVIVHSEFDDGFVFSIPIESWMSPEAQERSGVNRLYRLRLWHMDYSLLKSFQEALGPILNDCIRYSIDIEHAYYKNLQQHKIIEVEKVGVCGNIAPSGEYIDE